MRVVVFGAGRMGETRARALATADGVTEVVVANRTPGPARVLAESIGGRSCGIEEGLALEADAAVVTVATAFHLDILAPLIDRGVPILCEKPLTLDVPETEAVVARANEVGALLHVGFHRRFDDDFVAARALLGAGDLGSIYHVRMLSHDIAPGEAAYIEASGGIFRDLLVHDFDLAAWLFDSPVRSVYATGSVRFVQEYAHLGDLDNAVVVAELANGIPALITGTRHSPRGHDVRVELYGSVDSINVGGGAASEPRPVPSWEAHTWRRAAFQSFMERFEDAFRTETHAFVAAVASGGVSPTPAEAALEAMRVAEACERSMREGRRIDVERA
jgi:myo-inositol 2-dehydrogenase / D-chiro-inositol 1-dehydrogenase